MSDVDAKHRDFVRGLEVMPLTPQHPSEFFCGRFGFVLRNGKPLPFRPLKGRLGFFDVDEAALYEGAP